MVSERVRTRIDEDRRRAIKTEDWEFDSHLPSFDEQVVDTQEYQATIIRFPGNRFRTVDDKFLERMLMLSAEAVEKDW